MTSYLQTVARGSFYRIFFLILASFIGYLIRIILSKSLTLKEFGLFYSVFAFVNFFILFGNLGLVSSLVKFLPEYIVNKEQQKISSSIFSVFSVISISSLVVIAILILSGGFLAEHFFKIPESKYILYFLCIYFALEVFVDIITNIFLSFKRMLLYSIREFLINSFVLIFIISSLVSGVFSPVFAYIISLLLVLIIFLFFFFKTFPINKYKPRFSYPTIKKFFRFGILMLSATIGGVIISSFDTLMLTYFDTLEKVGVYNVVLPTAMILVFFGSSISAILFPVLSEMWTKKYIETLIDAIAIIHKYGMLFTLPIGFIFMIYPEVILNYLFGEEFIIGVNALRILTIGVLLYAISTVNIASLSAFDKVSYTSKIVLSATALNIILNFILIPMFSIDGAAIATTISYMFILISSTIMLRRILPIKYPFVHWIKTWILYILFLILGFYLKKIINLPIFLEITVVLGLSITLYFVGIFLFKFIKIEELRDLVRKVLK